MTKMKTFVASTALAFVLAAPAFAGNTTDVKAESTLEQNRNGGYDATTTTEKETPSGTIKHEAETNLDVDSNGNSTKTTTVKHTNDPKGLLNKHTTKDKTVVKNRDGHTTVDHTRQVDGDTVQDTQSNTTNTY